MRELRWTAAGAGVIGQVAAAVAGVVPWALLPVVAGLFIGSVALAERATEQRARLLNGLATAIAVALAVVAVPHLSDDRDALRTTLGLLLVLIQVVHGLTWRSRRDVEIALGIAAALLVLGASFAPDVLVGLPLLLGWATVVAGVVLCVTQRMREGVDAVIVGGRRAPLLAATSAALVLGLACFLLVPVPETPSQRNPLQSFVSATGLARGAATYSASRLDMRVRGNLSDKPVLEVPADSPPLWRSQVFGLYGGLAWSATSGQLLAVPGPPWTVGTSTGSTRSDRAVRRSAVDDGATWAPAEAVQIDADRGRLITDGEGTVRSAGIRSYTVVSSPQERDPAVLRGASTTERTSQLWLQLPATLPDRVRVLSTQLTASAPTRYDAVVAVETWLRANATYALDSPVPGRDEDAVDRFLFVDRTGFCEQFAAAETVLLRAAGVPARLVTGLAAGARDGDRRVFREKDLHAWVEVFYPGIGWSPSDPTAQATPASGVGGTSVRARLVASVNRLVRTAESVPGGRLGLAGLLVLVGVGISVVARLHRPRTSRPDAPAAAPSVATQPGPALAAFLRYDDRLGERRRKPHESLNELARRLDAAPRGALAVVEAECYGATPPTDAARAAELLDRLQPTSNS